MTDPLIDELCHLVELSTSELRDLARSGWSAVAERHALEMARSIDEKLDRLIEGKTRRPDPLTVREALAERHEAVCACPFDGSDPDCNLTVDGAWLGTFRLIEGKESA